MKILYAIQTTGNGHLARAQSIIPRLREIADIDIITSGPKNDFLLEEEPIYHYYGLTFFYTDNGAVNWFKTIFLNNYIRFIREIISCPINKYDLIINDFEPVSAWSAKFKKIKCFELTNQYSMGLKNIPKPNKYSRVVLHAIRHIIPSNLGYGYHYKKYTDRIFFPVIRNKVRNLQTTKSDEIIIYLPTYSAYKLINVLSKLPQKKKWTIFSPKAKSKKVISDFNIEPLSEELFLKKFASCYGIVCAGGFATTSEAIFLGKPMLVVPVEAQIEQQFNAAALKREGVAVIDKFSFKNIDHISKWIESPKIFEIKYKDESKEIVEKLINDYSDLNKKLWKKTLKN
ncbi:MAG: hypothetical protein CMC90_01415 [Flavobacteriaceae bacterium]|nr:hypothetical protein [Flavobacteriaceae bacterium]|tara:strand:+ start:414 stop:1442 length:1029 start_codon:yes stop_codon:yes gene_type:complete